MTPGGIPARNVALPVIGQAYKVYCFDEREELAHTATSALQR